MLSVAEAKAQRACTLRDYELCQIKSRLEQIMILNRIFGYVAQRLWPSLDAGYTVNCTSLNWGAIGTITSASGTMPRLVLG